MLASTLLITSCGSAGGKSGKKNPAVVKNLYTNLSGGNGPILVVKIDDTPPAHPQINLDKADVVYIEQVEGVLSRIAALFSNPKTIFSPNTVILAVHLVALRDSFIRRSQPPISRTSRPIANQPPSILAIPQDKSRRI